MVCGTDISPCIPLRFSAEHPHLAASRSSCSGFRHHQQQHQVTSDGRRRGSSTVMPRANTPPSGQRPQNLYTPMPTLGGGRVPPLDLIPQTPSENPVSSRLQDAQTSSHKRGSRPSADRFLSWEELSADRSKTKHPPVSARAPDSPTHVSLPPLSSGSLPPSAGYLYLRRVLPAVGSDTDFSRLSKTMEELVQGCFYHPDMDSASAQRRLAVSAEGSFVVRSSSDPSFLFALSVKTGQGVTSIRIAYYRGFFQLDCEDHLKRTLPRFETLMDLLNYHILICGDPSNSQYRWLDPNTPRPIAPLEQNSLPQTKSGMKMVLRQPVRHSTPSLKHLARVAVNRGLPELHLPQLSTDRLPLPDCLKTYLRDYPYKV